MATRSILSKHKIMLGETATCKFFRSRLNRSSEVSKARVAGLATFAQAAAVAHSPESSWAWRWLGG